MIIPLEAISSEILNNIIEAYVLQEGTDYGLVDATFEEKKIAVKRQLENKSAVLVYSELHETVNILPAEQFNAQQNNEIPD